MNVAKYILPVVAGCIVGISLITFGEIWLHHVYSLPVDTDIQNKKILAAAVRQMPTNAFIALLAIYVFASFAGGIVASLASGRTLSTAAIIAGVVLTIVCTIRALESRNPLWFIITNLFVYIPFAYLGFLVVQRKNVPADS